MPQRWIGSVLRVWGVLSRLYFKVVIASLALAFISIAVYYVLPDTHSPLLLVGVLPIFVLVPVTALVILGIFLIIIVSLIAQRTIIAAAKRHGRISLEELVMETGIYRDDLLPILDNLVRTKKITFVTPNEVSCEPPEPET